MSEFILSLVVPKVNMVFITTCLVFILFLRIYIKVVVERPWKNFAEKFGFTLNWKESRPEVIGNCGGMDYRLFITGRTIDKKNYGCTVIKLFLPEATGFSLYIYPEKNLFKKVKKEIPGSGSEIKDKKIPYVVESNRQDLIHRIIPRDFCALMAGNNLVSLKIKNKEICFEYYEIITDIEKLALSSRITWQTARNLTRLNNLANSSI